MLSNVKKSFNQTWFFVMSWDKHTRGSAATCTNFQAQAFPCTKTTFTSGKKKKKESRQVCEHLQSPEHRHLSTAITPVQKCRACSPCSEHHPARAAVINWSVRCCSLPVLPCCCQPHGKTWHEMIICLHVAEVWKALSWGIFKNKPQEARESNLRENTYGNVGLGAGASEDIS